MGKFLRSSLGSSKFLRFQIIIVFEQALLFKTNHELLYSELRSGLDDTQSSALNKSGTFVSDQNRVDRALWRHLVLLKGSFLVIEHGVVKRLNYLIKNDIAQSLFHSKQPTKPSLKSDNAYVVLYWLIENFFRISSMNTVILFVKILLNCKKN